jgi:hypothetical protein
MTVSSAKRTLKDGAVSVHFWQVWRCLEDFKQPKLDNEGAILQSNSAQKSRNLLILLEASRRIELLYTDLQSYVPHCFHWVFM